jgi:hypothetical protein
MIFLSLEKIKARPSIHLAWQFLASIPSGAPIRVVRYARDLNDPVFLRVLASYA